VRARQDLEDTHLILGIVTSAFTVGAIIVATVLFALAHKQVRSWVIVVIVLVALLLIAISYVGGRRHSPGVDDQAVMRAKAKAERALEEVTVATSYLSNIDDIMTGIHLREQFG
jgi:small-conductance mechanosensitive channel